MAGSWQATSSLKHSHGPSLQCLHDVLQILWPKVNIAVERQVVAAGGLTHAVSLSNEIPVLRMECLEGEDTFNKHLRVDCPNQDKFISRQFMIMPHVFICIYIYIYSIYDEGNEALHSVGFQVHDGGSSVQDPRDTSRTLVAWQVGILFPVFVLRVSWAFPSSQDIAGFRRLTSCVCVVIVGVSWFIFMAQYGNYGYGYAL